MAIGAGIAGSLISAGISRKNSKDSARAAKDAIRRRGNTGRSSFDTRTGNIKIDPRIAAFTANTRSSLSGLKDQTNEAFDRFTPGLQGIREKLGGLSAAYESNSGEFINSQLNPIREALAKSQGETERSLARRGVSGSFAEQTKSSVARSGEIALSDKRAELENQRIGTLSNFLGMDASLLQAGLTSETGRISMLKELEQTLSDLTQDEFNRETELLGIASGSGPRSVGLDSAAASSKGIAQQAGLNLAGDIFGAFGRGGSGISPTAPTGTNPTIGGFATTVGR